MKKDTGRNAHAPLSALYEPERFRETPEEEIARDRRTLKRIAIGSLHPCGVSRLRGGVLASCVV